MKKKAVIIFSGGLDSTTCLAIARDQGFDCLLLTIDYGQKHRIEIEQAKKISQYYGVLDHKILTLDLTAFGGSSLTDKAQIVPDHDEGNQAIPSTYVPARNTIFLSLALAYAEANQASDIFLGINAIDYSGYPDCRPKYLDAFVKMANLATRFGVEGGSFHIHAPLLYLDKAAIIKTGHQLGVPYKETISCYRANEKGEACGSCDSCIYRKKGFSDAGVLDPTRYYR